MSTKFRIILVGDSGVGKSSLLMRFVDEACPHDHFPTIGIDFRIKTLQVNNRMIKLHIFDTAGQEKYRSITSSYYRGCDAILLVYDITDHMSFQDLNRWIDDINVLAPDSLVLLVGAKKDLESKRQVGLSEAQEWARLHHMEQAEVSAEKNSGIDDMFTYLVQKLLQRRQGKQKNLILEKKKQQCC